MATKKNFFYVFLGYIVFLYLFLNTAWVAEDAFITFRSVDQLLAGHGAVWNIGERVQVYTHPLWYFLVVLGKALGVESYLFVLLLSALCLFLLLTLTVWLARRQGLSYPLLFLFLFLATLSRSFIDYSSSGLENPLIHLLLGGYVAVYVSQQPPERRFFYTTLFYALVFLTRPDAIIMLTPASLALFIQLLRQRKPWLKPALLGLAPAIIWELFSLFYYGSLTPNTALAKVNIGYSHSLLAERALEVIYHNFLFDPLTFLLMAGALLATLVLKSTPARLLMAGVVLQLAYIVYVGGDYMFGRFFSGAFYLSLLALLLATATIPAERQQLAPQWALIFLAALFSKNYQPSLDYRNFFGPNNNGNDTRGFYFQRLGLLPVLLKHGGNYKTESNMFIKQEKKYSFNCLIGQAGWNSRPDVYIIDPLALSEPFLARLPAKENADIGHYQRAFPAGYVLSRVRGGNHLENPVLARLYDDVLLATQADLLDPRRLGAIWRLNSGHYKHLERYFDRNTLGSTDLKLPLVNLPRDIRCMGANTVLQVD